EWRGHVTQPDHGRYVGLLEPVRLHVHVDEVRREDERPSVVRVDSVEHLPVFACEPLEPCLVFRASGQYRLGAGSQPDCGYRNRRCADTHVTHELAPWGYPLRAAHWCLLGVRRPYHSRWDVLPPASLIHALMTRLVRKCSGWGVRGRTEIADAE